MSSLRFYARASLAISTCLFGLGPSRPATAQEGGTRLEAARAGANDSGDGLVPAPMPEWFKFQSNDTVNGWINNLDNKSITAHAWELWGGMTTLTEQLHNGDKLPVFGTWWIKEQVLAPPGAGREAPSRTPNVFKFETPRQFKRATPVLSAGPLLSIAPEQVRYNDSIKKLIESRKYNDGKELARINSGWGTTKVIADRKILDFNSDAIMLKAVYRFVPAKSVSILPYWAGPINSNTPSVPAPTTWTKKMVVIPPDLNFDARTFKLQDANGFLPAVPLSFCC